MSIEQKIAEMDAELRELRVSRSMNNTPSWSDVRAVEDKLSRVNEELARLKGALAGPALSRDDVQRMLDAAWQTNKMTLADTFCEVFRSSDWRAEITKEAVELLRNEIGVSIGAASKSASAAVGVARINAESAVLLLRSTSNYFARA